MLSKYFIIEKPYWNNKGISFKLSLNQSCYIVPTMFSVWDDYYKKKNYNDDYHCFDICKEKNILWLWFVLSIKTNIVKQSYNSLSVDELFKLIPPNISINNVIYKFHLTNNGNLFKANFKNNNNKSIININDEHLLALLEKVVLLLYQNNYVKFMNKKYKQSFESLFNIKIS